MQGIVLKVESARSRWAVVGRETPPPDRRVTRASAIAMLAFELDAAGDCRSFALHSVDRQMAGERVMIEFAERRLAQLAAVDGRLVTLSGRNDLAAIRLATLRLRAFDHGAAAGWLRDSRDAHDIMSEMMGAPVLDEVDDWLTTLFGSRFVLHELPPPAALDRMVAEFSAVKTMTAYLLLLAERHRSVRPLARGIEALADALRNRPQRSSHLSGILQSDLFQTFAADPF